MKTSSSLSRLAIIGLCIMLSACLEELSEEAAEQSAFTEATESNRAPTIEGTPSTSVMQGASFEFSPEASDPDGDPLVFGVDGMPEWMEIDTGTGLLSGVAGSDDVGTYRGIAVWVSDGDATTVLDAFDLSVMPLEETSNTPPTIEGSPETSVVTGEEYRFEPDADDVDDDPLTFNVVNRPAWASFNRNTGVLAGTPPSGSEGTYEDIVVSVRDGQANATLPPFDIEVTPQNVNSAPRVFGNPPGSVEAGRFYSFRPTASDPDDDPLTFSIENAPGWAGFNPGTGRLSGTPGEADVDEFDDIVIRVSDGVASDTLGPFSITVVEPVPENEPPTISGSPSSQVTSGQQYSFQPTADDPDDDALTFSITNRPGWAVFDTQTGALEGTPANGDAGTYSGIVIGVSDGRSVVELPEFTIMVVADNEAPTISGNPDTQVMVAEQYEFEPNASDPDGDALTFSITNRPGWATFDSDTGRLAGTPGSAGTYSGIRIVVTDGEESDALSAFSITVSAAPNGAPTISGTPSTTVTVGAAYTFEPNGDDPDDDDLTFSIQGAPSWATFNASTGRLQGTPDAGDVGTYSNIRISVSDGEESDSLAAFSIAVNAIAMGSATLSWTPPAENTDGSTLTDLAGYTVHWGRQSGSYSDSVDVNVGLSSYVVENLGTGTWYFATRAYNDDGLYSEYSNEASKTIQ